jgi:hypothetical protein
MAWTIQSALATMGNTAVPPTTKLQDFCALHAKTLQALRAKIKTLRN